MSHPYRFCRLTGLLLGLCLLAAACSLKPSYLQGRATDVPNRWTVEAVEPTRLSEDQREVLARRGPPTYVRFFREVETRKPVYTWIYVGQAEVVDLVWFVEGRRVEAIAVDSDPSAFSSTTRRWARNALLVGTGAAVVPTIFLLANR